MRHEIAFMTCLNEKFRQTRHEIDLHNVFERNIQSNAS
jgi:hypothetical protein